MKLSEIENNYIETMKSRFWRNVDKTDNNGGCWFWNGAKARGGYGIYNVNKRRMLAHRVAYIYEHGDLGDFKHIFHSCNNPSCVRPDHLSLSPPPRVLGALQTQKQDNRAAPVLAARITVLKELS